MFNVILLRQGASGPLFRRSLHTGWHFFAVAIIAVVLAGGVGATGFVAGQWYTSAARDNVWQLQLLRQQARLRGNKSTAGNHIDALTNRMARLQSRVARLDALGRKLVDTAGIDSEEFDFSRLPGRGGPADDVKRNDDEATGTADTVDADLARLGQHLDHRERQYTVLNNVLAAKRRVAAQTPAGEPIDSGWISSTYGKRDDPIDGEAGWHPGIDFAGKKGDPVRAVAAGVVSFAGPNGGYGRMIKVIDGDGYATVYGHSSEVLVDVGDVVHRGDKIALMGSTGRSTGPHVHLEVHRDGRPVNPMEYVRASR